MNIQQLLSASQSSPQAMPQGALSRQDASSNSFQQILLQASDGKRLSEPVSSDGGSTPATALGASQDALHGHLSELSVDKLGAALSAMGLDLNESDLSALLAQLQLSNLDTNSDTLNSAETVTALDEITTRLDLIAAFSGDEHQASTASSVAPAVIEAISQHLNINQAEAAQLVSALNVSVIKHLDTHPLPAGAARLSATSMPPIAIQTALGSSPDHWFAQLNTGNAATQISSEALIGALLTSEGAFKGPLAGEPLLTTGLQLPTGSSPLASAPQAQGFAPAVAPTQAILSTPFTSSAWPQQLSQQLVQISKRGGEQHVQMQLHPADLGPLSISLKFGEQGAQAHFLSAHAQVRQALEQALPQLREALAEQGISLGETSVGEQRNSDTQNFAQSGGRQSAEFDGDSGNTSPDEILNRDTESSPLSLDGRVDLYA